MSFFLFFFCCRFSIFEFEYRKAKNENQTILLLICTCILNSIGKITVFSKLRGVAKIGWQVGVINSSPYRCQNVFITDFRYTE